MSQENAPENPPAKPPATTIRTYRIPTASEAVGSVLRRFWLVLLILAAGGGLAVLAAMRFKPVYQSFALIRLRAPSEARIGGAAEGSTALDPAEIIRRLKIALGAKDTLEAIIKQHAKLFSEKELANRDALVEFLGSFNFDRKSGDLYQIVSRARTPEAAQAVAEGLAEKALVAYRADAEEQAVRLEAYARKQVEEASEKLKALENQMVDFLEKHPVMKLKTLDADRQDGDRLRAAKRASPINLALARSGEKDPQLKELLAKQTRLKAELRSLTESASSNTSGLTTQLQNAKAQLATLKREQGLTDAHPQVKSLLKRIKDLEAEIAKAAPGSKSASSEYVAKVKEELRLVGLEIRKRVAALAPSPSGAAPQKEDTTELEAEWNRMRRQHTLLSEAHTKLEEVAVNAALKKNLQLFEAKKMASIVSKPRPPEAPTGLTRMTIIIAASVVSLLFGLAGVVLLGLLDTRLQKPEHITRASDALSILAVLVHHPLKVKGEVTRIRHQDIAGHGDGEARPALPMPEKDASVIQWLRGTDDLDQAISLLKSDPPAGGGGGEGPEGGWLEGVQTAFFDRNSPKPMGAPAGAMIVAPRGGALTAPGDQPMPREGAAVPQVTPPKICVLPSAPPYAPGLFVSVEPHSKPAEQMRLLASRLESRVGSSLRVVAVSSWEEGVGKTTIAANLIMVLAESQKRVLAVDACPGKASLTRIFGIEPDQAGLCGQLQRWLDGKRGSAAPWELDQIAETLTICPAEATPRPALPLLASEAFTRFVADMGSFFDVIVIDTEALSAASDAVVLQRLVDGYLMVVSRGRSTTRSLQSITTRIDPARILGFVFNER